MGRKLQSRILGNLLGRLPHTQITEDVLRTAEQGIESDCSVIVLDTRTKSGLCDTATTENLNGVSGSFLRRASAEHLKNTNGLIWTSCVNRRMNTGTSGNIRLQDALPGFCTSSYTFGG